jgi:hypothetical protein
VRDSLDTEQAFKIFAERANVAEARTLADFCGVAISTAQTWLTSGPLPKGEKLIKLRVFLDAIGLTPRELSVMSEERKVLVRAIGVGVISIEDVKTKILGYENLNGVFDTLLRNGGILTERKFRMERFEREKGDEVEAAYSELKDKLSHLATFGQTTEPAPKPAPIPVPPRQDQSAKVDDVVRKVADPSPQEGHIERATFDLPGSPTSEALSDALWHTLMAGKLLSDSVPDDELRKFFASRNREELSGLSGLVLRLMEALTT